MNRTLNLSTGFTPIGGEPIPFKRIDFPSGFEPHIRVTEKLSEDDRVWVTCRFRSAGDLMLIGVACDAVYRAGSQNTNIFVPYLPHARMDRSVTEYDAVGKRAVTSMLASTLCPTHVFDVHSDGPSWPVTNHGPLKFLHKTVELECQSLGEMVIVSPDKGAASRLPDEFRFGPDVSPIAFEKHRDPATGRILSVEPETSLSDVLGRTCLIIDDICDGGGTFIPIAQKLKQAGAKRVALVVSHGLFTKGLSELVEAGVDHFYTTDSVVSPYGMAPQDNLTVVPVGQCLSL
jgi:ribose-phosphate pyrophosphokinase